MNFPFEWNPYADQPHNVASRSERFRHHLRHAGSYFALAGADLRRAVPILTTLSATDEESLPGTRCRLQGFRLRRFPRPVPALSKLSLFWRRPASGTLSSASPRGSARKSARGKRSSAIFTIEDSTSAWPSFNGGRMSSGRNPGGDFWRKLSGASRRSSPRSKLDTPGTGRSGASGTTGNISAWPRRLSSWRRDSAPSSRGPAVIDFEFHLYPALLPRLPFAKATSHLYVDRMGAPENAQCGWTAEKKIALLKATVDISAKGGRDLWITEVNWPLAGTGPYSPASGKPNVTEEEQADYLVRYYVPALASGLVERIYWWQLVAPGYGLVDSRDEPWRRRPSFAAFSALLHRLEGSRFERAERGNGAEIFYFSREGRRFAVAWAPRGQTEKVFERRVDEVFDRGNGRIAGPTQRVSLEGSPKYVFFSE